MTEDRIILFRYEAHCSFGSSPYCVFLYLREFTVVRETPKCYVIDEYGKERFILKDMGGKRYAYTTKELAKNSCKIRASRRVGYLERDLEKAKAVYQAVSGEELWAKEAGRFVSINPLDWDIDVAYVTIPDDSTNLFGT